MLFKWHIIGYLGYYTFFYNDKYFCIKKPLQFLKYS